MKQTAVEWLLNEIDMQYPEINVRRKEWMVDKAIEMEKEQIIEAWMATDNPLQRMSAEQYYNETYK
jgi:hypothetical protein